MTEIYTQRLNSELCIMPVDLPAPQREAQSKFNISALSSASLYAAVSFETALV
jgi:hypothetical protein